MERYEKAWRTAGTELVGELFADGATYRTAPFEEPLRGLAAIRKLWDAERSGPDEVFSLESETVAVEGDTAVVRLHVRYADPPAEWRDLWIITFGPAGRCTAFEEWPFAPRRPSASRS